MAGIVLQGYGLLPQLLTQGYGVPPFVPAPPPTPVPPPAPAVVMGDVVDDDTEQAVVRLWNVSGQLSSLFAQPPRVGRQYSTQPARDIAATGPYVVLDCKLARRELAYADAQGLAPWHDYRAVTLTVYGTRADVVQGVGLILGIFGRKMGAPGQPTLTYPSGARFMRWWPKGDASIEEDKDTKAGKDVWRGVIQAEVWSIRPD